MSIHLYTVCAQNRDESISRRREFDSMRAIALSQTQLECVLINGSHTPERLLSYRRLQAHVQGRIKAVESFPQKPPFGDRCGELRQ
jgi:hypothetical protein